MARAVILPPIDRDFAKEVSALAKEGQKLIDGYSNEPTAGRASQRLVRQMQGV
jgi:hypothetical protein